ncbi:MAG TPA: ferrous iron transport protein B [Pyrinomonadaceae bacterium]|jgi:ferrous iron transport protein B|nr:ferrous iron transport protein B [Pyrinomonadaceae bacterium]
MSTTLESPSRTAGAGVRLEGAAPLTVALAGNPNAGKTSIFNVLTGLRQKVANYPGVTVERKEGSWTLSPDSPPARLVDLPGLYSLDAASLDEQIAHDIIMGRVAEVPAPDVVVAAVDSTNLERNLYLVTQLLEAGRPLVVALTMVDLAEQARLEVDARRLGEELGVPVVAVNAKRRTGFDELARAVIDAAGADAPRPKWRLSPAAEQEVAALSNGGGMEARAEALRELYGDDLPEDADRRELVEGARVRLARGGAQWWQEPVTARYDWIEGVAAASVKGRGRARGRTSATERIDRVVTHRLLGPAVLLLVMLVVFQTIFSWASLPMDLIDRGFGALGETVRAGMPRGLLNDLVVDGVIAGVGGVLVFLPQILLLFFFIALLEDTGYMARAAFLMDRLMRGVGLHGKAFMPLLSSFACAIPGIMATRTIENPKDRLATIMIAPFMSCSARLPVYTLMIAAFFSEERLFGIVSLGAVIILSMYLLGVAVAIAVAWVLKHTILKSPPPPLVLEMPPYRAPNLLNVAQTMRTRAWLFVKRAGTVILAISILLWALMTFPRSAAKPTPDAQEGAAVQAMRETGAEARGEPAPETVPEAGEAGDEGEQLRQSYAGRLGHVLEPAIAPLGFDWKMGIGLISSFAARETLVSTLSIVYNVGKDADAESPSLIEAVRAAKRPDGSPAWTPLVAVSMMVFFVLACQCMSTVAIVRRETNSWRWPLFMVAYMLVVAYVASFITYQGGRLLGLG